MVTVSIFVIDYNTTLRVAVTRTTDHHNTVTALFGPATY